MIFIFTQIRRERCRCSHQTGVNLEVVMQPPARSARIEAAEQLSMRQLLEAYARATDMREEVFVTAEGVLKVWRH
jgi:hypothetical protein